MAVNVQQMKKRLEEKRAEIQQNISSLTWAHPDPEKVDESSEDFGAEAVEFNEMQQEQAILVNEQALLTEVEDALKRTEDGSYGTCVVCGQPIPDKRLEAIPWAARCIKDEELLERSNLSREELYDTDTL